MTYHRFDHRWLRSSTGLYVPDDVDPPTGSRTQPGVAQDSRPPTRRVATRRAEILTGHALPYLVGALPLLMPLLAASVFGDRAVLRVLLWQGNLVALFVGMLQGFAPTVVGSITFLVSRRILDHRNHRAAAVMAALAASPFLAFTSVVLAVVQSAALVALLIASSPRSEGWFGRLRGPTVAVFVLVGTMTGGYLWSSTVDPLDTAFSVLRGRAFDALPREVAVEMNGSVTVYYFVASDDKVITAIAGYPNAVAVISINVNNIVFRLPCRDRQRGVSRSLADLVLPSEQRGGTAFCGDLAECLQTLTLDALRSGTAVEPCVQRASGIQPSSPAGR